MYSYDISMTNTYKPTFTADIKRTPWFNAGIKRAKELVREGSEEGLNRVNKFISNIELIKSDKSFDVLDINPDINVFVNGEHKVTYKISDFSMKDAGDCFMSIIDYFVQKHYSKIVVDKLAEEQIPELGRISELSIKLDSATTSAQRKLSGMIKTIDAQA